MLPRILCEDRTGSAAVTSVSVIYSVACHYGSLLPVVLPWGGPSCLSLQIMPVLKIHHLKYIRGFQVHLQTRRGVSRAMSQGDSGHWPKCACIIPTQVIGHILLKDFPMGRERHEDVASTQRYALCSVCINWITPCVLQVKENLHLALRVYIFIHLLLFKWELIV